MGKKTKKQVTMVRLKAGQKIVVYKEPRDEKVRRILKDCLAEDGTLSGDACVVGTNYENGAFEELFQVRLLDSDVELRQMKSADEASMGTIQLLRQQGVGSVISPNREILPVCCANELCIYDVFSLMAVKYFVIPIVEAISLVQEYLQSGDPSMADRVSMEKDLQAWMAARA